MKSKSFFFLDVMYYYTHLQYETLLKKVSPSNQPSIILGTIVGFPMALLIDSLYILFLCSPPPAWIFITICFGCIFLMLKIYEKDHRKKSIIKAKPTFFNNKKLSLFITITVELISLAALFLGGPIGKYLLEQCGWMGR